MNIAKIKFLFGKQYAIIRKVGGEETLLPERRRKTHEEQKEAIADSPDRHGFGTGRNRWSAAAEQR